MKNYFFDSSQNYFIHAKNNSKNYLKLKVKNINDIEYLNNDKINLGFVSCDLFKIFDNFS